MHVAAPPAPQHVNCAVLVALDPSLVIVTVHCIMQLLICSPVVCRVLVETPAS